MIVQDLRKKGKDYQVIIEGKSYTFDEEIVVKYRLVKGKELPDHILDELENSNVLENYKKKALAYHLKYMKSSLEVVEYLKTKEISEDIAIKAVEELKQSNLLNDKFLIIQMASALARNSNGPMLIRQKLKHHLFTSNLIDEAIESLSEDDIILGKEKLMKKAEKKYVKLSEFEKKRKIKEMFFRHGY